MAEINGRLIIIRGLPGLGKTTHAKGLETRLGAVRFAPDEWMDALSINLRDEARRAQIEALQWKLAQRLFALNVTAIIEWGTWGRSERDALRLGAREVGAAVELHYLSVPLNVLFERLQRRGIETPPITQEQLAEWSEIFQAPTDAELALFDQGLIV